MPTEPRAGEDVADNEFEAQAFATVDDPRKAFPFLAASGFFDEAPDA